jgi:sporulation protein YlmC with PRC-barrel domain
MPHGLRSSKIDLVRLVIGCPVRCSDGDFGEISDVVIDPTTRRVTHLVVQPHDREGNALLVSADWARASGASDAGITLDRTLAEIGELETIREAAYLRLGEFPVDDPDWDVGVQDLLAMPYYQDLGGVAGASLNPDQHITVKYDRIPKGEVELRRASAVRSSDGHHLGHVDGFVVDDSEHITHIVLERGHVWGKREVAIPVGAIAAMETDSAVLSLTQDEVGAIRATRVHRWRG